jgi:hypothetical protein
MKTAFRVSTFVWAGMVLDSPSGEPRGRPSDSPDKGTSQLCVERASHEQAGSASQKTRSICGC